MNNNVTSKIKLRVERNSKSGLGSVCLQSFVNKTRAYIPLSIYIQPKYFDEKAGVVKQSHPDAAYFNKLISEARSRVSEIQILSNNKKLFLTAKSFRIMFEERGSTGDFLAYMESTIIERYATRDLKRNSYKNSLSTVHVFRNYRKELHFSEIDVRSIDAFRLWLKGQKLHINTIAGHLKNLRTYMNRAIEDGYQFEYPFKKIKITRTKSHRLFLVETEVQQLLKLYDAQSLPLHLHITLMYFLASCFTSLRSGDSRKISQRMVVDKVLFFEPEKTNQKNKWVKIPLSNVAQRIVTDVINYKGAIKSEQRMNDDLKLIALHAGINKPLTFHVGRHTFATVFLRLGGKVEVLQDIMSHESIKTTMEYVHIVDTDKQSQIDNFNQIFQ